MDLLYPTMIPEPDYCDHSRQREKNRRNSSGGGVSGAGYNDEGLIVPKKLQNPCADSIDRQNLHRELLFNHKIGKNVLNQKSELQKALEKHKDQQVKKEMEKEKNTNKSAFEKVIEERAKRLETLEKQGEVVEEKPVVNMTEPEFLKVHAKLRARMDAK